MQQTLRYAFHNALLSLLWKMKGSPLQVFAGISAITLALLALVLTVWVKYSIALKYFTKKKHKLLIWALKFLYELWIIYGRYWSYSDIDDSYLGGLNTTSLLFNWHPVLMVAGMVLCFISAIVMYRMPFLDHQWAKYIHAFFHTIAVICIGLGISAVFQCMRPNNLLSFAS